MGNVDLKLKLLSGLPIEVNGFCSIKPKTIKEIVDIGYTQYAIHLNAVTLDLTKTDAFKDIPDIDKYSIFDVAFGTREELLEKFLESILFFVGELQFSTYDHPITPFCIMKDNGVLHSDNYMEFVKVIKLQSCIDLPEEEFNYNPANEKAAKIAEKLKKSREKVKEAKKRESKDNGIDFSDIVSAVSTKSNSINKFNVWNLTLYQLYDEFNRLKMIDDYDKNWSALIQGAKDLRIRHWSESIKE